MTELWIIGAFFVFVMAGVTVAGYFMLRRAPAGNAPDDLADGPSVVLPLRPGQGVGLGLLVAVFQMVGQAIPGARSEKNPLRQRLLEAGYRLPSAVSIFYGIKCAAALAMAGPFGWISLQNSMNPLISMFAAAAAGYMIPDRILARAVTTRADRLRRALPTALDMMVMAVEAGQSIDQALIAASRGLKNTSPDLASELIMLHMESRATNNRIEALRNFATRNKEKELKKFSALLIDADRFGTGIGPALRDHSKYMRIRFRQQAQESARKVGVKLIFPVFFLIFPSVILVTLGPAVILILTQMKTLVGN